MNRQKSKIPIATFLLALLADQLIISTSTNESWSENRFWCPPGCVCSTPARIIDCSSRGLASIPNVPRIVTRLYLHDNHIRTLASHQFKSLQHLTYLILASNEIREVQPEAFSGLHSLKYLILDSNNITLLPRGVFRGLKHLETVTALCRLMWFYQHPLVISIWSGCSGNADLL